MMSNYYLQIGVLADENPCYQKETLLNQCKRGCDKIGVDWEEVQAEKRLGHIVDAKRLCCMYLRDKGWGLQEIAEAVGLTNHTSAHYHHRRAKELIEYDPPFKKKYLTFIQA